MVISSKASINTNRIWGEYFDEGFRVDLFVDKEGHNWNEICGEPDWSAQETIIDLFETD